MRRELWIVLGALAIAGCQDNTPPPPRVPVPAAGSRSQLRESEYPKPLPPAPGPGAESYPPPYDDEPLVTQRPPEQRAFVDVYNRVGRPRILVFVNRTLEGQVVPVNRNDPLVSVEAVRRSTTGVTVESKTERRDEGYWDRRSSERSEKFATTGPAEYRESVDVYLRPGQYDEAQAKSLDYEAMENILTDWVACNGQVTVISPTMARQRLTDQQVKELQDGRPRMLGEIAQQLDADVLVQVQAHPTRQTPYGLEVRLVAEAMNVRGGQSIGRAVVDIPPPLEKTQLNKYTRFVARKLMDDMVGSWTSPPPASPQGAAPTTQPK